MTPDPVVSGNAKMAKGEVAREDGHLNEAKGHFEAAVEFYGALNDNATGGP